MDEKKAFFARPTAAEIKKGKEPVLLERKVVIAGLEALLPHQNAVIPEELFTGRPSFHPETFLKKGETYVLDTGRSYGKSPRTLFRDAVTTPQTSFNTFMSGYSFRPRLGPDRVVRRVPLVELLEAARIIAYGKAHPEAAVRIEGDYTHAQRVYQEGGAFLVSTPSRTEKADRYGFTVRSIPMKYSESFVYFIPYGFDSQDLGAKSRVFRELRYNRTDDPEPSRIHYVQAHAIAANYAVVESELAKDNEIPLRFLVFPTVSQQAVDMYATLMNRSVLQFEEEGKIKHKTLLQSHIEAIFWGLVRRKGYEAAFDDKALLEGRVRNYNWNNHVQA